MEEKGVRCEHSPWGGDSLSSCLCLFLGSACTFWQLTTKKIIFCQGYPLVSIHMGHKYLYVLCPLKKIYPQTSSQNLSPIFQSCSFQVSDHPAKPLAMAHGLVNHMSGHFSFQVQCTSRCTARSLACWDFHFLVVPAHSAEASEKQTPIFYFIFKVFCHRACTLARERQRERENAGKWASVP